MNLQSLLDLCLFHLSAGILVSNNLQRRISHLLPHKVYTLKVKRFLIVIQQYFWKLHMSAIGGGNRPFHDLKIK